MTKQDDIENHRYTCNEYREEMILLGLKKRLQNTRLTEKEKQELLLEIDRLEKIVGF